MTVVDPKSYEKDKLTYLGALYDLATEHADGSNILMVGIEAQDIAERCKFDGSRSERIFMDLEEEGLIKFWATGPVIGLTKEGRDYLEAERFKKSPKGRIRAVKKSAIEKAKDGAIKLVIYVFGLSTPTLISWGNRIAKAVLHWLGLTGF